MIARAIKYVESQGEQANPDVKTISTSSITDAVSIPKWAAKDIQKMLNSGIMEIGLSGKFEPVLPVTRANAVVALKRMLQKLNFIN